MLEILFETIGSPMIVSLVHSNVPLGVCGSVSTLLLNGAESNQFPPERGEIHLISFIGSLHFLT